ncbi:MAG: hypothetical protein Tsb0033_27980 [Winogradskyella sp.]
MKSNFNNLILPVLLTILVGCSNTDDGDNSSSADYSYNGESINFNFGISVDGEESFGYYNNDFVIGTSMFSIDENTLPTISINDFQSTQAILYATLYNEGSSFEVGTYNYSQTDISKYFDFGYIRFPGEDNEFDLTDDYIVINGGTITVSGSEGNYTVIFDVNLANGDTLDFTYDNSFIYY